MKKSTGWLFIFFCCFTFTCFGQDAPKHMQIGITGLPIFYLNEGSGGAANKFHGFAIYGNLGFMLSEKNGIGVRPFWGIVDNGFQKIERMTSMGLNVYYRRYFNQNRLKVFADVNLGLGYLRYTSDIIEYKNPNTAMFNYAVGPGFNFEIKNGVNVELLIQYLSMSNISDPDTIDGEAIIPSLGVQKFF